MGSDMERAIGQRERERERERVCVSVKYTRTTAQIITMSAQPLATDKNWIRTWMIWAPGPVAHT